LGRCSIDADCSRSENEAAISGLCRATIPHIVSPARRLYLFDTFEGFDACNVKRRKPRPSGRPSLTAVQDFVGSDANVVYCQGCAGSRELAFAHIDCDLGKAVATSMRLRDVASRRARSRERRHRRHQMFDPPVWQPAGRSFQHLSGTAVMLFRSLLRREHRDAPLSITPAQ